MAAPPGSLSAPPAVRVSHLREKLFERTFGVILSTVPNKFEIYAFYFRVKIVASSPPSVVTFERVFGCVYLSLVHKQLSAVRHVSIKSVGPVSRRWPFRDISPYNSINKRLAIVTDAYLVISLPPLFYTTR